MVQIGARLLLVLAIFVSPAACSVLASARAQQRGGDELTVRDRQVSWERLYQERQKSASEEEACSCSCCDVVERRPDEVVDDARIKCAPSEEHSSEVCSDQCLSAENDRILRTAEEQVLDYLRFCFFECKPAAGVLSPVSTQCVALDEADIPKVVDTSGNAIDPAVIYAKSFNPNQFRLPGASLISARHSQVAHAPSPAANSASSPAPLSALAPATVDPKLAAENAVLGKKWATEESTDAREVASKVREGEAFQSRLYHEKLQTKAGVVESGDPYAEVAAVRQSALASQMAAQGADNAAEHAVQVFNLARAANWNAALDAAKADIVKLGEDAQKKKDAKPPVPPGMAWRQKAAEAARKAYQPYMDSIASAQRMAAANGMRAASMEKEAANDQTQAESLTEEAKSWSEKGRPAEARTRMSQAKAFELRSKQLSANVKVLRRRVKDAQKTIDGYYAVAQQAATMAVNTMPV